MTTPLERTRSRQRCRESLRKLRDRAFLCPADQAKAAAVLVDYPTTDDIAEWITKRATTTPTEAGQGIAGAGALLRGLWRQSGLDVTVQRDIDEVLRHFLDAGAAKVLVDGLLPLPIDRWLAYDDIAHAAYARVQAPPAIPSLVDIAREAIGNNLDAERRRLAIAAADLHQANADGLQLEHVACLAEHWETLRALLLADDLLKRARDAASGDTALAADLRFAMHRLQLEI